MSAVRPSHSVEIAAAPEGILVAYSDPRLDGASGLRLDPVSGKLDALLGDGGTSACGRVSPELVSLVRAVRSVVWARLAGADGTTVAVSEISLETV